MHGRRMHSECSRSGSDDIWRDDVRHRNIHVQYRSPNTTSCGAHRVTRCSCCHMVAAITPTRLPGHKKNATGCVMGYPPETAHTALRNCSAAVRGSSA